MSLLQYCFSVVNNEQINCVRYLDFLLNGKNTVVNMLYNNHVIVYRQVPGVIIINNTE
jgi:hypothetical protein